MADRKNTSKYIPADFDPSKLGKCSTKPARARVNFVCPFRSMLPVLQGIHNAWSKFYNAVKEISPEMYLGDQIIRLHAKCPSCKAAIVIETDPENTDYKDVSRSRRCYGPWKTGTEVEERVEGHLDCLEREECDGDESPIQTLKRKAEAAKQKMQVADALDEVSAVKVAATQSTSRTPVSPPRQRERKKMKWWRMQRLREKRLEMQRERFKKSVIRVYGLSDPTRRSRIALHGPD